MAKMRPEEELIRQDKAFRNPAAAPAANPAASPVSDPRTKAALAAAPAASPVTEESALQAAQADKDTALSGLWPGSVDEPKKFPEASGTGFYTSEGLPIESSYGLASNFWSQIGINNILDQTPSGAMSYQGYLAYNGITDPRMTYRRNLDAAQEMYARAIGTYGASGEGLAQGNLANAGYSEYLTGLAYQQKFANTMQAQSQLRQDLAQTAMQYQQYLENYEANKAAEAAANAALGDEGAEVESGALSETQAAVAQYLRENAITNAADIETARIALRNQGYSDADIDAAITGWMEESAADLSAKIGRISSLASGNADLIKETYGENSEAYKTALAQLQKKNAELVSAAVNAVNSGDFDGNSFSQLMTAARESTATTDEEGNSVYNWDSMNEEEKASLFMQTIRDMYESGDIDQSTYQEANYDIISETVKTAMNEKYMVGAGRKQLINVLESLAYIEKYSDAVSEDQRTALFKLAADKLTDLSRNEGNELRGEGAGYKFRFNGKKVSYREASGSIGGILSDQQLTEPQYDAMRELLKYAGVDVESSNREGKIGRSN